MRGLVQDHNGDAKVHEVMINPVLYCFDDQDCPEVADNMAGMRVCRLPVVSRDKRLVGMVSLGDVAREASSSQAGQALSQISQWA